MDMKIKDAISVLRNERACVARAGQTGDCDRQCENCDLLMQTDDILAAYDLTITSLERERWIPVEERLPELYDCVLISIDTVNGYGDPVQLVTIGGYDSGKKCWEQYTAVDKQLCRGETVTHWMPLPEPPKEDHNG